MPKPRGVRYLYHATHREQLESILDFGLIRGFRKGVPGHYKSPKHIHLDVSSRGLRKWLEKHHPNDWVIISVNLQYLDREKLQRSKVYFSTPTGIKHPSTFFTYKGDIPPEALHVAGGKR